MGATIAMDVAATGNNAALIPFLAIWSILAASTRLTGKQARAEGIKRKGVT